MFSLICRNCYLKGKKMGDDKGIQLEVREAKGE
jgi:hypothetical protein